MHRPLSTQGTLLVPPEATIFGATVSHGSNANVARPLVSTPVQWIGLVQPTNMRVEAGAVAGDTWLDTSASIAQPKAPTLVVPPASTAAANDTVWYIQYGCYFARFDLTLDGTFQKVWQRIGTASGNVEIAVVSLSGSGLLNYTKVKTTGIVTALSIGTGNKAIDFGAFQLAAGPYALAWWADNTTVTAPHTSITTSAMPCAGSATLDATGIPGSGSLGAWTSTRRLAGFALEGAI